MNRFRVRYMLHVPSVLYVIYAARSDGLVVLTVLVFALSARLEFHILCSKIISLSPGSVCLPGFFNCSSEHCFHWCTFSCFSRKNLCFGKFLVISREICFPTVRR